MHNILIIARSQVTADSDNFMMIDELTSKTDLITILINTAPIMVKCKIVDERIITSAIFLKIRQFHLNREGGKVCILGRQNERIFGETV